MLNVKIKRLSKTATPPIYGSAKAACMDLYADIRQHNNAIAVEIMPHQTIKLGTGFAFQPPEGYCGLIFARSGLATKQGLRPANCVGVCDEDYTGEYIVPIHNDTDLPGEIKHGDRIAQVMFVPYEQANLILVDELDTTERGNGGFGSSGK